MPFFSMSATALAWHQACYDLGWVQDFNWPGWAATQEAQSLFNDPAAVAGASVEQLERVITAAVRGERFCEGALLGSFETGLLTRIVRRAAALEAELPDARDSAP